MISTLNESIVEDATLKWFGELRHEIIYRPRFAPSKPKTVRTSFADVVLVGRLREAIRPLNPAMPYRTLATLRDMLLPKLLSGELRYSEPKETETT